MSLIYKPPENNLSLGMQRDIHNISSKITMVLHFPVLHFPVPHFPAPTFGPTNSGPAFSASAAQFASGHEWHLRSPVLPNRDARRHRNYYHDATRNPCFTTHITRIVKCQSSRLRHKEIGPKELLQNDLFCVE